MLLVSGRVYRIYIHLGGHVCFVTLQALDQCNHEGVFLKESGCQTKLSNYPTSLTPELKKKCLLTAKVHGIFSENVPNKMHLYIKQKTVWKKWGSHHCAVMTWKNGPPETFQFWALGIWPWWILCAGPCTPRASLKLVPQDRTVPWQRWASIEEKCCIWWSGW